MLWIPKKTALFDETGEDYYDEMDDNEDDMDDNEDDGNNDNKEEEETELLLFDEESIKLGLLDTEIKELD